MKSVLVIHDYEISAYRKAAAGFANRFAFTAFNPNTGLLWNDAPVDRHRLAELNSLIKRHSRYIRADDRHRWTQIIDENCKGR